MTIKEALLQDVFLLCLLFVYNRKLIIKTRCMSYLFVFKRSLLGVKICLSHAQIGLSQVERVQERGLRAVFCDWNANYKQL